MTGEAGITRRKKHLQARPINTATARAQHVTNIAALNAGISLLDLFVERIRTGEIPDEVLDKSLIDGSIDLETLRDIVTNADRNWEDESTLEAMISVLDEVTEPPLEYSLGVLGAKVVPTNLADRQRIAGGRAFSAALRNRAIAKKRAERVEANSREPPRPPPIASVSLEVGSRITHHGEPPAEAMGVEQNRRTTTIEAESTGDASKGLQHVSDAVNAQSSPDASQNPDDVPERRTDVEGEQRGDVPGSSGEKNETSRSIEDAKSDLLCRDVDKSIEEKWQAKKGSSISITNPSNVSPTAEQLSARATRASRRARRESIKMSEARASESIPTPASRGDLQITEVSQENQVSNVRRSGRTRRPSMDAQKDTRSGACRADKEMSDKEMSDKEMSDREMGDRETAVQHSRLGGIDSQKDTTDFVSEIPAARFVDGNFQSSEEKSTDTHKTKLRNSTTFTADDLALSKRDANGIPEEGLRISPPGKSSLDHMEMDMDNLDRGASASEASQTGDRNAFMPEGFQLSDKSKSTTRPCVKTEDVRVDHDIDVGDSAAAGSDANDKMNEDAPSPNDRSTSQQELLRQAGSTLDDNSIDAEALVGREKTRNTTGIVVAPDDTIALRRAHADTAITMPGPKQTGDTDQKGVENQSCIRVNNMGLHDDVDRQGSSLNGGGQHTCHSSSVPTGVTPAKPELMPSRSATDQEKERRMGLQNARTETVSNEQSQRRLEDDDLNAQGSPVLTATKSSLDAGQSAMDFARNKQSQEKSPHTSFDSKPQDSAREDAPAVIPEAIHRKESEKDDEKLTASTPLAVNDVPAQSSAGVPHDHASGSSPATSKHDHYNDTSSKSVSRHGPMTTDTETGTVSRDAIQSEMKTLEPEEMAHGNSAVNTDADKQHRSSSRDRLASTANLRTKLSQPQALSLPHEEEVSEISREGPCTEVSTKAQTPMLSEQYSVELKAGTSPSANEAEEPELPKAIHDAGRRDRGISESDFVDNKVDERGASNKISVSAAESRQATDVMGKAEAVHLEDAAERKETRNTGNANASRQGSMISGDDFRAKRASDENEEYAAADFVQNDEENKASLSAQQSDADKATGLTSDKKPKSGDLDNSARNSSTNEPSSGRLGSEHDEVPLSQIKSSVLGDAIEIGDKFSNATSERSARLDRTDNSAVEKSEEFTAATTAKTQSKKRGESSEPESDKTNDSVAKIAEQNPCRRFSEPEPMKAAYGQDADENAMLQEKFAATNFGRGSRERKSLGDLDSAAGSLKIPRETNVGNTIARTRGRRGSAIDEAELSVKDGNMDMARCYLVWKKINNEVISLPFRKPVQARDAPGYYEIVKNPMDLDTIKRSLGNGDISTPLEFLRAMCQIYRNAMLYNPRQSDLFDLALEFKQRVRTDVLPMAQSWCNEKGSPLASGELSDDNMADSTGNDSAKDKAIGKDSAKGNRKRQRSAKKDSGHMKATGSSATKDGKVRNADSAKTSKVKRPPRRDDELDVHVASDDEQSQENAGNRETDDDVNEDSEHTATAANSKVASARYPSRRPTSNKDGDKHGTSRKTQAERGAMRDSLGAHDDPLEREAHDSEASDEESQRSSKRSRKRSITGSGSNSAAGQSAARGSKSSNKTPMKSKTRSGSPDEASNSHSRKGKRARPTHDDNDAADQKRKRAPSRSRKS